MSQLYGQLNFTTQPNLTSDFDSMFKGIAEMPFEKHTKKQTDNFAIGHLLTYNTPEAIYEVGIENQINPQVIFTFCGRIDNRNELCSLLGVNNEPTLPDGTIARLSYEKWGTATFEKFYGDWHLVVYHKDDNRLILARDKFGTSSLYYYQTDATVLFATLERTIVASTRCQGKIDEEHWLRSFLLWFGKNYENKNKSFFEGIQLVPHGHYVEVAMGNISKKRYWFPEKIEENFSTPHQQQIQEFYEIFEEAVRCRLRSNGPIAAMLSGGLDSGSIATVAAELLKKKGQKLTTFSHVPLYKSEIASEQESLKTRSLFDETENILATANKTQNIQANLLNSAKVSPSAALIKALEIFQRPFHGAANSFWIVDIHEEVKKQGFTTLLGGEMGNATISLHAENYLLSIKHPVFRQKPSLFFKQKLLRPIVFKYFLFAYERFKPRTSVLQIIKRTAIQTNLLHKWKIVESVINDKTSFNVNFPNKQTFLINFLNNSSPRLENGSLKSNYFGFEYRDPTGDARVIEKVFSMPMDIFVSSDGQQKNVVRTMMRGKMPETVLFNKRKGMQAADIYYRLRADEDGITQLIQHLKSKPKAHELIDFNTLDTQWEQILRTQPNAMDMLSIPFTKALMYCYFYCHFDKNVASE